MIRKASSRDLKKINNLGIQLFDNFESTYNINNYLGNNNYIILINEESVINGLLIVYKNIDYYELELIVVDYSFRKKGIGQSLMNNFFANYCSKGDKVILEVKSTNYNAISFYKKNGFKVSGIRKKYYKNDDAVIMEVLV